jgi:alanine-synthesizing transaminase
VFKATRSLGEIGSLDNQMPGFLSHTEISVNSIEQALRLARRDYIDLTSSNPTRQGLLFPPDVLRSAAEAYWATRVYAPDSHGLPAACESIARYYARRRDSIELDPRNIFITASTSEAYGLLFALLTEPGDNLLAPNVTYPLFEYLASIYHVELRPYMLDESRDWQINPMSLYAQVNERTRGVLIISPHNPTGMIVQKAIPALDDLNLPLICDEVFAEFTYGATHTPPMGTLHPQLPVFHLNGISKLFALPDLKLGWIALNNPAVEKYYERLDLLNDMFLSANSLTQAMLPALFEHGAPFVASMQQRVRSNIEMALEILAQCHNIEALTPDGGYYLFPAVHGWDDEDKLVLHLLDHGVLVHPGYFYGYQRGAHIMISCLTEPDALREGLTRLVGAL